MTSAASQQFFETFPPEVARGILEGDRLRVHAAKVSVVRDKTGAAFAIDTLPRDGRPKEWERTTQKIGRILKSEVDRLPAETKRALAAVAHILPLENRSSSSRSRPGSRCRTTADPGGRCRRTCPWQLSPCRMWSRHPSGRRRGCSRW